MNKKLNKIGAVIPCYMGGDITIKLVKEVLKYADIVVLVDDHCPLKTGRKLSKILKNPNLHIIFNKRNLGVGGATKKGFYKLLEERCDIILKIDADNQMNPADIPKICSPIINNECDATKGNRFTNLENLINMPKIRLFGNLVLSYITKLSTGYWEIFDPTNGFIAFRRSVLEKIDLQKINDRFFFETDLLFRCGLKNISINNVELDISYSNKYSSLNPLKELPIFLIRNIKMFFKRVIYQYFILDFNPGSIEIFMAILLGLFSLFFGSFLLYLTNATNVLTSAGTVSIFIISTIVSIQFLIGFIYYDCSTRVLIRRK